MKRIADYIGNILEKNVCKINKLVFLNITNPPSIIRLKLNMFGDGFPKPRKENVKQVIMERQQSGIFRKCGIGVRINFMDISFTRIRKSKVIGKRSGSEGDFSIHEIGGDGFGQLIVLIGLISCIAIECTNKVRMNLAFQVEKGESSHLSKVVRQGNPIDWRKGTTTGQSWVKVFMGQVELGLNRA